jgi:hypothetical protein
MGGGSRAGTIPAPVCVLLIKHKAHALSLDQRAETPYVADLESGTN